MNVPYGIIWHMRRTSILIDESTYEAFARRARRRGTTVSEEIRETLNESVQEEPNPNQAWLDLADAITAVAEPRPGPFPPVDSDEAKDEMVRAIHRDAMNREPDW